MADEFYPQQRKGYWIPVEIMDLAVEKKVTFPEFRFYLLVWSLSKARGEGCFASNAYLAKQLGVSRRWVQGMVTKGIKNGFLINEGWKKVANKKFRSLSTTWCAQSTGRDERHFIPRDERHFTQSSISKEIHRSEGSHPKRDDSRREGGNYMGFFSVPEKNGISPDAKRLAKVHRAFVGKKNWYISHSKKKWATEFQKLINQLGTQTTEDVLLWYHENHPEHFRMKLQDGKAFKDHFETIRIQKDKSPSSVEVSAAAEKVAKSVSYLHWPKGSKDQIAATCQITLDHYQSFRDKLKDWISVHYEKYNSSTIGRLGSHLLRALPPAGPFTLYWIGDVQRSIVDWEGWSGNLLSMAFKGDLNQPRFRKFCRGLANEYNGKPESWDKLAKELS